MKRLLRSARRLGLPLTVAVGVAWFLFLRPPLLGGSTGYIIVAGHSMEPHFYTGDLAILRKHGRYRIGAVVAYQVRGGVIIHRIVGGSAREGYVVKGDNKPHVDFSRPTPANIVGTVWLRVPKVGLAITTLRNRRNLPMVAGLVAFAAALSISLRSGGRGRPVPGEQP